MWRSGMKQIVIAEDLKINRKTVQKWVGRSDQQRSKVERTPKITKKYQDFILRSIIEHNFSAKQIHCAMNHEYEEKFSFATICNWTNKLLKRSRDNIDSNHQITENANSNNKSSLKEDI